MNNKELKERLKNIPKDKYIYQRYNGKISKYLVDDKYYIDVATGMATPKFEFILSGKTSENIIDLIEVGDYVNGYKVRGKTKEKVVVDYYCYSEELADGNWLTFYNDMIESIVTHEQFSSIEYKV